MSNSAATKDNGIVLFLIDVQTILTVNSVAADKSRTPSFPEMQRGNIYTKNNL